MQILVPYDALEEERQALVLKCQCPALFCDFPTQTWFNSSVNDLV